MEHFKGKNRYYYLIVISILAFMLGIAGITFEVYQQNIPSSESLNKFQYFITPLLLSVFATIFGYFYIKSRILQEANYSKLLKNEEKYRSLFENMTDIVCMLDSKGKIIDINKAGVKIYEYSKAELLNMNVSELVYVDDIKMSDKYFKTLEETGKYNMYEGRTITKSGKVLWIQVNSTKFTINGIEVGSQDIIRDITVRKEIEQKVVEQNIELEDLNATKDKFFSIIAHDLKSPCSSLLSISKLLTKNYDKYSIEKQKEYIALIQDGIHNTHKLLEDLLVWARSQRGTIDFNPKKENLYFLTEESTNILRQAAKNKSITTENQIDKDFFVDADRYMLSTIIRNLTSNAIKFTPRGGTITINARKIKDTKNNKFAEITVKDNGVGIAPEIQNKLFKINKYTSTRGTENETGTGLGLVLCKDFVEKHGGKIWIESEIEKGSKFIFSLPK